MEDKMIHEHEHEHEHHHHHDHEEECSCGHEHHHHDDHEHEHHHHHHHDHEEECSCGHEHHHHDDHDHEHHHHDHGHSYDVPGFRLFETHNHEGAVICSFEKDVNKGSDILVSQMESCIKSLEKWLDDTDSLIGHVKGYVKEAGVTTTFSTVGNGLNVESHDASSACVGFAAIVFGPTEEELKDQVAQIFAQI